MEPEKIKESLEICSNDVCEGCALYDETSCLEKLLSEARKYILELEKAQRGITNREKFIATFGRIDSPTCFSREGCPDPNTQCNCCKFGANAPYQAPEKDK